MFFKVVLSIALSINVVDCGLVRIERSIGDVFTKIGQAITDFVGDVSYDATSIFTSSKDLTEEYRIKNNELFDQFEAGQINQEELNTQINVHRYEYQQALNDRATGRTGDDWIPMDNSYIFDDYRRV